MATTKAAALDIFEELKVDKKYFQMFITHVD